MNRNSFIKLRCATINVATYGGKEEEIVDVMKERRVDVMGLAEMRLRGEEEGRDLGGGYVLTYKGVDEGIRKHGVGVILGPRVVPFVQKIEGINERLIKCTFKIKGKKYHVYQIYAPQQGHTEGEKGGSWKHWRRDSKMKEKMKY